MDDEAAKAHAFHDEVIPAMDALRAAADEAESIVDEDYWPLPCYSRMLFLYRVIFSRAFCRGGSRIRPQEAAG